MNRRVWVLAALLLGLVGCSHAQTRGQAAEENDREDADIKNVKTIGDVTEVGNVDPTLVSGVGLVSGLDGTGGGVPPGEFRKMLEDQLHKQGVQNVQELFSSTKHTLVLVSASIPPGVRKGDPLDIEVVLPPQSKATSLRGGYLLDCPLYNYAIGNTAQGGERMLKGHILAKARGPLLVGFGEGKEEVRLRRGRIWEGGISQIDSPFYLYLKNDQKFASVANAVANRINSAFPEDAKKQFMVRQAKRLLVLDEVAGGINEKFRGSNGMGRGEAAHAVGKDIVYVNVPYEYRLNPERYLRIIRVIPLRETPENAGRYRNRLYEMLLDPKETILAARRLEALGKQSVPALQKGLTSNETLVRFASAEALAYLGSTSGIEELARLAEEHATLRGLCLSAMASLNESCSQSRLVELMKSSKPDARIGAFRALLALNEVNLDSLSHPEVRGELLNESFWLYRVVPLSTPMVHVAVSRRAEVVIFWEAPVLVPPLRFQAGTEFTVLAAAGDDRCTISRYMVNAGARTFRQCSCKVEDILQTLAELGGQYPDAVDLLGQADRNKCLSCALMVDALPSATSGTVLAACGSDASQFKDDPEFQQEVRTAQQDLGTTTASSRPFAVGRSVER